MVVKNFAPYQSWEVKAQAGDPFAREQFDRYQKRPEYELYDLRNDPYEMVNLADHPEHAETMTRLKAELENWMQQQGDMGAETEALALERMSTKDDRKKWSARRTIPNSGKQ